MPEYDVMLNIFTMLFVTLDPPGLLPTFVAITAGMSRQERNSVAIRGVGIGFLLLLGTSIAGLAILNIMGITIAAFRVAGGLLLFYIAFEMIFEKRIVRQEESSKRMITHDDIVNIAVFPLAIPLIAGPGAISATILSAGQIAHSATGYLVLNGIILANLVIMLIGFLLADRLERLLGDTGTSVLTRLMGVLLAALSVQFVADGAKTLFMHG